VSSSHRVVHRLYVIVIGSLWWACSSVFLRLMLLKKLLTRLL